MKFVLPIFLILVHQAGADECSTCNSGAACNHCCRTDANACYSWDAQTCNQNAYKWCGATPPATPPATPAPPAPLPRIVGGWNNCPSNLPAGLTVGDKTKPVSCLCPINYPGTSNNYLSGAPTCPDPNPSVNGPSWLLQHGNTAILPGKFDSTGDEQGLTKEHVEQYPYSWFTIGGANVPCPTNMQQVENDFKASGAKGFAIDIEAGSCQITDAIPILKQLRLASNCGVTPCMDWNTKFPQATYMLVPSGGGIGTGYEYSTLGSLVDYIAIQLYNTNYNSYYTDDTNAITVGPFQYMKKSVLAGIFNLVDDGWSESQIVLGYESFHLHYGGFAQTVLTNLANLLKTDAQSFDVKLYQGTTYTVKPPFAGLLGWPAQCDKGACFPEVDHSNLKIIKAALADTGLLPVGPPAPPTTSAPPTPSPTPVPTPVPTAAPGPAPVPHDVNPDLQYTYDASSNECVNPTKRKQTVDMPYHTDVDNWEWDGWATTTNFRCTDDDWGNPSVGLENMVNARRMNNPSIPSMAAAIPWPIAFSEYGSKDKWGEAVGNSFYGKNDVKACFVIQPISNTVIAAPQIALSQKQLNDTNSAATWALTSKRVPGIKIIPFEGCGGNCPGANDNGEWDCYNDCGDTTIQGYNGVYDNSNENWKKNAEACCFSGAMYNSKYLVLQQFKKNDHDLSACSCPYGVDDNGDATAQSTQKCKDESGGAYVNWCSGKDMHFDLSFTKAKEIYWKESDAARTPAGYVVRYKRVKCDIWEENDAERSLNNKYSPPHSPSGDNPCEVSEWGNWGKCSVTCGGGSKTRSRSVTKNPNGGCPALTATDDCNKQQCGNDCQLSTWSSWSECSCDCIHEALQCHRTRTRSIIESANLQGKQCDDLEEQEACYAAPQCPPPSPGPTPKCVLSNWGAWGACTTKCGGGMQTRRRTIKNCMKDTKSTQTQPCNDNPCIPVPTPAPKSTDWSDGEIVAISLSGTLALVALFHSLKS
tara:strand:+ start:2319 stop:5264 length:2946 start_codon:yes stop_codon:yes gene_type:complete